MNDSPDLGNNIDYSEESNLRVDFKRTLRNSQQTSKHISKRRPPVVVNTLPENQRHFPKYQYFQVINLIVTH